MATATISLARCLVALLLCASCFGCSDGEGGAANFENDVGGMGGTGGSGDDDGPVVGFEILEVVSPDEIVTWAGIDVSQEGFDAIELPTGWFKNQPRELDFASGVFARSPGASADGEFTMDELFGQTWRHVATIVEAGVELDDDGLLLANTIVKFHTLTYAAGSTLFLIVSPEGEAYVRVTRDQGRESDQPTIPDSWDEREFVTPNDLTILLPNPTINIRTDNQDSFQGPVPGADVGL